MMPGMATREAPVTGPHPGLIGDDPGVFGVGLAVAAVGGCRVVNSPARKVEHPLRPVGQQRQQQRRRSGQWATASPVSWAEIALGDGQAQSRCRRDSARIGVTGSASKSQS